MNPEGLLGKYATLCCSEDMFQIMTLEEAGEIIEWNIENAGTPSMCYSFADNLGQANKLWSMEG